jgi:hypothetical protein
VGISRSIGKDDNTLNAMIWQAIFDPNIQDF